MFWRLPIARTPRHQWVARIVVVAAWAVTFARPSAAHVALDTPKSGVTLAVGSTVSVTWEDTILHDGVGYDLDLVGADAMIQSSVASGLPTSVHSFDWVVPDIWCVGCYLMVTQLNRVDHDYSDSALINIYGKPAVVESGGSGGSPSTTGGSAGATPAPGSGGAGNHSAGGVGGTLESGTASESSAGSASSAGSLEVPSSTIPVSTAGASSGGKGGASVHAAAGATASADAGSSAAGDGSTDAPDESAGEPSSTPSDSGGCAIGRRRSPRSGFALLLALVSFAGVVRRRSGPGCR